MCRPWQLTLYWRKNPRYLMGSNVSAGCSNFLICADFSILNLILKLNLRTFHFLFKFVPNYLLKCSLGIWLRFNETILGVTCETQLMEVSQNLKVRKYGLWPSRGWEGGSPKTKSLFRFTISFKFLMCTATHLICGEIVMG